jgi:hypothetical protein
LARYHLGFIPIDTPGNQIIGPSNVTTTPTVFVLDPNFTPPSGCADIDVRPAGLRFDGENACADLIKLIATTDSETVGFIAEVSLADALAPQVLRAAHAEQSATLVACGPVAPVWTCCSPRLASLAAPPEDCGLLLVNRELVSGNLREVGHPLWDWLIRHVADRKPLAVADGGCADLRPLRLPELVPPRPGRSARWLFEHLCTASGDTLIEQVRSPADGVALEAGLFQLHDYLDESHERSQSVQGAGRHVAGDYWHGIMHRREPDYSNAKYWFRRVGRYPIFAGLADAARSILDPCPSPESAGWSDRLIVDGGWNPLAFVDLCAAAADSTDETFVGAAERIQYEEMLQLLCATAADAGA